MRGFRSIDKLALVTALVWAGTWLACGSFGSTPAGPTTDGGTAPDDGGVAADGPPSVVASSFCDGPGATHKRCIDFDRVEQVAEPFGFDKLFDDPGSSPPGTLSVDGLQSKSAPNSLHVRTLGGGSAEADIVIDPAGALPLQLNVATRFRYDVLNPGTSTSSHFLSLRCRTKRASRIYLKLEGSAVLGLRQETTTDGGGLDPPAAASFGIGQWHQLEVTFNGGATPNITVTLDGAMPFGSMLPLETFSCGTEALVLRFGSWVSSGAGDYELRFDDILVDWS